MSYFIYNGTKSSDLGVFIQSKNIYSSPKYDASLISIPGRNGDLISPGGRFGNASVSYTCFVSAKTIEELSDKMTAVKAWLYKEPGEYHDLSDSYDTKFKRSAFFNSKLDIADEAKKIGTFTVTFSCMPQRYLIESLTIEAHTTSFSVSNPYPLNAKPYIKISGSGNVSFAIQSGGTNRIWNIKDVDGYIECDSELMNFYKGTTPKNDTVTGTGFPTFLPGNNTVSFGGGITSVDIIPRWQTL